MFKISKTLDTAKAAEVLAQYQKSFAMRPDTTVGIGEATEFTCHCGGVMHRFDPTRSEYERLKKELGQPRYSRRKRQAKKNQRKWRQKAGFRAMLLFAMARPLRNPMGFICAKCGSRRGFYQMMAEGMFQIQPMPEGAKPVYSDD
jgi:hypothetical protein